MKRQTKAIKIAGITVIILALITVLLIQFLREKVQDELVVEQYNPQFVTYLMGSLEPDATETFQQSLNDRLLIREPLYDEEVLALYLEQINKDDNAGVCINEGTVISYDDNLLSVVQESDGNKHISQYRINRTNAEMCFYLPEVKREECLPGASFRFVAKDDEIIVMLKQTAEQFMIDKAWIQANDEELQIKYLGNTFQLEKDSRLCDTYTGFEDIADIMLERGVATEVKTYQNKIHGKLLSLKQSDVGYQIELDGIDIFPASMDMQVYDLCNQEQDASWQDLTVGYDFTDFVLDDDGLCVAALIVRQEKMQNIRVVLKTEGYEQVYHEKIQVTCDTDYDVIVGEQVTAKSAGELIEADMNSEWYDKNRIKIMPKAYTGRVIVNSLLRSQGTPAYRGILEIEKTENGFLLVNELPLNEYLYSVVPSEMPASYPPQALAAQAVSARTYAYSHMLQSNMQKYGAHVDDSASFQVYNNMLENEATTLACRQTAGEILYYQGNIATTYFYSTSCGYGTDMSAWTCESEIKAADQYLVSDRISDKQLETETALDMTEDEVFAAFIKRTDTDCFEQEDSYFRWCYQTTFDEDMFWENLKARYDASPQYVLTKTEEGFQSLPIDDNGKVLDIEVVKRAKGGAATELEVTGQNHTYKIMTEKNIRYIMANKDTSLSLGADYSKEGKVTTMIPSAFMTVEPVKDKTDSYITAYTVFGGGYGHGIGMSQNGAKAMAKNGYTYRQILSFFYRDTELMNIES